MSTTDQAKATFQGLLENFGGTEVAGVIKIPGHGLGKRGWHDAVEGTLAAICKNNPDTRILLMLDELPYMLQSIAAEERSAGADDNFALAVLDTLRAARHEHANLRMIFCGSVGLHHVLKSLRGGKHASQPVNDMPAIEIHPLKLKDAVQLAEKRLELEEADVAPDLLQAIANQIAQQADCVPFYIERVVSRLAEQEEPVVQSSVDETVQRHLVDDRDDWEMEHFRTRLEIYYDGQVMDTNAGPVPQHKLARRILDHIACEDAGQSIDAVWAAMKAKMPLDDRDAVIDLLSLLAQDHYLVADNNKHYTFRFPLIRRWWIIANGLQQGGE
ncbi:hypothetical protein [Rosistilla oblonga]|uniref:hypothetical protein n=1 Tax=Rosistilla oblonga TaxID=2527990 RepID=UPI003A9758C2